MKALPEAVFHRVERRDAVDRMLTAVGVWSIELDCEYDGQAYEVFVVEVNPEVHPLLRYFLVLSSSRGKAPASISLAGKLLPITHDGQGKPWPTFPFRVWQLAHHAIERARREDRCNG